MTDPSLPISAMRHPLHPLLAHFPVACWSLTTLADFASLHYGQPAWYLAGTLLWIGVVMALPTLVAGIVELIQVPDESGAMRAAYAHMGMMVLALMLYLISLMARLDQGHITAPGTTAIVAGSGGFVALLIGGWLGGSLVYGHGVGRGTVDPALPRDSVDKRPAD